MDDPFKKSEKVMESFLYAGLGKQSFRGAIMPYCWKCGTELKENAKFCHKCGAPAGGPARIRRDWWE
jgi:rRNA maturation endonuclease Nob1